MMPTRITKKATNLNRVNRSALRFRATYVGRKLLTLQSTLSRLYPTSMYLEKHQCLIFRQLNSAIVRQSFLALSKLAAKLSIISQKF